MVTIPLKFRNENAVFNLSENTKMKMIINNDYYYNEKLSAELS